MTARDVTLFLSGQALGLVLITPFALQLSPLIFVAMGGFVLSRLLLILWLGRRAKRRVATDDEIRAMRHEALEGARGVAAFTSVMVWPSLLTGVAFALLTPLPLSTSLFFAGWASIIASYTYLARLY